jgi:RHS repeat-associated protein
LEGFDGAHPGPGTSYDAAGNQTALTSRTFSYDAETRLIATTQPNMGAISYVYDGQGHRVQKSVGSNVTSYVYDASGQLAAEYNSDSPASGTQYLIADTLGSTRLVLDASGNPKEYTDYLPFGEELPSPIGGRGELYSAGVYPSNPDIESQKFTSKERDAETGLDFFGARYMSSAQGRFTSADPLGNFVANAADPQTWNMYAYARNNPLVFVDPTGLACVYAGADNGTAAEWADPTNYIDDNSGGQSCADANKASENNKSSATSYGGQNAAVQEVQEAVGDFVSGKGPTEIVYGPNDPFTQDFQKSAGMDAIVAGIKKNCSQTTGNVPVGTGEAFVNSMIDATLGLQGFINPEFQLGAFNSSYSRSNGRVDITVTNPISLNSLALHVPEKLGIKNPTKGHFHTVNQTLQIAAPDPCAAK